MNVLDDIIKGLPGLKASEFVALLRATTPPSPRFVGETRVLSEEAKALTDLIGDNRSLVVKTSQLPASFRQAGLRAVPNYDVLRGNVGVVDVTPKQRNVMLDNLEALVSAGDPNFYIDSNAGLIRMAPGMPVESTALYTAPFSAGTDVGRNMELAARFIENPALYPGRSGAGTMTTGNMYRKALALLAMENPGVADLSESGTILKIGSFAENLRDPLNSMRATIDRHAAKAPVAMYVPDEYALPLGNERVYRFFEDLYKEVAKKYNLTPSQAQSAVWDAWRRLTQANQSGMLSPSMFQPVQVSPLFSAPADVREAAVARIKQVSERDAAKVKRATAKEKARKDAAKAAKEKAAAEKKESGGGN